MQKAKQTIETLKYGYMPGEFLPIKEGGHLINRRDFVAYKMRCLFVKHSLI